MMPSAPEIYGKSIYLNGEKKPDGTLDIAILTLAYTIDGKIIDAAIYDNTWDGFREFD